MGAILLTILITYLITSLFGYIAHWSLHQSWAGRANNAHMTHHLKLYPPEDYTSDTYRDAGKDSTVRFFAVISIPLILFPILLWALSILPLHLAIIILIIEAIMGFSHDYIHNSFHIHNHWMNRFPLLKGLFYKWNERHYIHHVDMTKNYGIFNFHFDRLLGTFLKK